ncbi:Gustatory receptor 64f [Carabus blaptoides fortunei]
MWKAIYEMIRKRFTKSRTTEIHVAPKSTDALCSELHRSLRFVLILAQCFALMPLQGIMSDSLNQIRFKWFSFRTLYCLINLCGSIGLFVFNFVRFLTTGMHFGDLATVFYFTSTTLTILLSIRLARLWHLLNEKWSVMETAMKHYSYKPNLTYRFKITTLVVLLLALGEHLLFISKLIDISHDCDHVELHPLKTFFGVAFAQIFALTPFAYWKAFLLEFVNINVTFAWNFMDLFIMLMCSSLAERFRQINKHVENTQAHGEEFWKTIREDYNCLSALCKTMDDFMSHLVSLSFGNNMFFICVQLFNTMKPISGTIHTVYFVCSFGFLLGRTASVLLYAAWINDESTVILNSLFDIPSEEFGTEASRLIQQISTSPVAITGSKYFIVTRDLCLKVTGAIMTFELILQQLGPMFLNTNDKTADKPFCLL